MAARYARAAMFTVHKIFYRVYAGGTASRAAARSHIE